MPSSASDLRDAKYISLRSFKKDGQPVDTPVWFAEVAPDRQTAAWRGRARGWRYRYVPDAVLRHKHAATSVEGSPLFHHFVERNRLLMLTKTAPWRLAASAAGRFVLSTGSYARRDIVGPVAHGRRPSTGLVAARVRSFGAYLGLAPQMLRDRRRLRAAQVVPDEAITGWSVER